MLLSKLIPDLTFTHPMLSQLCLPPLFLNILLILYCLSIHDFVSSGAWST